MAHWFDEKFQGLDHLSEYQLIATPLIDEVGERIWLTNQTGQIYHRDIGTAPVHGILYKVSQSELDDPKLWTKIR